MFIFFSMASGPPAFIPRGNIFFLASGPRVLCITCTKIGLGPPVPRAPGPPVSQIATRGTGDPGARGHSGLGPPNIHSKTRGQIANTRGRPRVFAIWPRVFAPKPEAKLRIPEAGLGFSRFDLGSPRGSRRHNLNDQVAQCAWEWPPARQGGAPPQGGCEFCEIPRQKKLVPARPCAK